MPIASDKTKSPHGVPTWSGRKRPTVGRGDTFFREQSMIHQRLRGFLGTTIATCIPWTVLGVLAGVVLQFDLIPGVHGALGRPIPGGFLTVGTLAGVAVGLINGIIFSSLLLATEHGKNLEEVRGWRFALWGAAATAGTLGLLIQVPLAVGIGGAIGAVAGLAAFGIARRARASEDQASSIVA